mmetsp:Transcript_23814/g.80333  ORF Transcript_23814/g.80333 Transcript_23814/m.80333 type:complete len:216 (+) Transcript_23814:712-1359(+)
MPWPGLASAAAAAQPSSVLTCTPGSGLTWASSARFGASSGRGGAEKESLRLFVAPAPTPGTSSKSNCASSPSTPTVTARADSVPAEKRAPCTKSPGGDRASKDAPGRRLAAKLAASASVVAENRRCSAKCRASASASVSRARCSGPSVNESDSPALPYGSACLRKSCSTSSGIDASEPATGSGSASPHLKSRECDRSRLSSDMRFSKSTPSDSTR